MQEHHRKLIEEQAEAWVQDAHLHGTGRTLFFDEIGDDLMVSLHEKGEAGYRTTSAVFRHDEMPLTAAMIRARFANPFGGK